MRGIVSSCKAHSTYAGQITLCSCIAGVAVIITPEYRLYAKRSVRIDAHRIVKSGEIAKSDRENLAARRSGIQRFHKAFGNNAAEIRL